MMKQTDMLLALVGLALTGAMLIVLLDDHARMAVVMAFTGLFP